MARSVLCSESILRAVGLLFSSAIRPIARPRMPRIHSQLHLMLSVIVPRFDVLERLRRIISSTATHCLRGKHRLGATRASRPVVWPSAGECLAVSLHARRSRNRVRLYGLQTRPGPCGRGLQAANAIAVTHSPIAGTTAIQTWKYRSKPTPLYASAIRADGTSGSATPFSSAGPPDERDDDRLAPPLQRL